jgi:hypothetical protein
MITELTLENRRLKEELTRTHYEKFQLEQDLTSNFLISHYILVLRATLEQYLPKFNEIET